MADDDKLEQLIRALAKHPPQSRIHEVTSEEWDALTRERERIKARLDQLENAWQQELAERATQDGRLQIKVEAVARAVDALAEAARDRSAVSAWLAANRSVVQWVVATAAGTAGLIYTGVKAGWW